MVNLTIDGKAVCVPEGTKILDAAKRIGINLPTLCFLRELNEIGSCRICSVEIEGNDKLTASCNTDVQEGMVIHTHSPRVIEARRSNLELILSQHNSNCTSCIRSSHCSLQRLAVDFNISDLPFSTKYDPSAWDYDVPIIRDPSKCIGCLRCVAVCDKVQNMRVWDVSGTGSRTRVGVRDGLRFTDVNCTYCGQCITHCPCGALHARNDTRPLYDALFDKNKVCIVQVAPAVRAAWGEDVGLTKEQASVGRMVSVLRTIGFDYVFDTDFSADLTIMEEGSEFVERMTHRDQYSWPMFTSCCPGWVRFLKLEYPEYVKNLSTAKSPQQMFGAVAKSYWAEKMGIDPENIFCVSIMPCTAKKYECSVEEVNDAASRDVDLVLTTRELERVIRVMGIDVAALPEDDFDDPLGESTGAGVIFGTTGGVMEAALRSAHFLITGKNPDADAFHEIRTPEHWLEKTLEIGGITVRIAIVNGLGNTRKLMEAIRSGKAEYDFVEVMACPSGCGGGGGQPFVDGQELGRERGKILHRLDSEKHVRFSHENASVQKLYSDYLEAPNSHRAHELLHTDAAAWKL